MQPQMYTNSCDSAQLNQHRSILLGARPLAGILFGGILSNNIAMEGDMPSGGAHNIRVHTCPDGKVRRVEPVYFREESSSGSEHRVFKRSTWFCYLCRYSDGTWTPTTSREAS